MPAMTEQHWRTMARVGALTLAVAAGLAACTTTQPSATPSSSPSPSFAADVAGQCEEIAEAIVAGRLRDADDLLADAKLGGADPTCADEAKAVVAERRTQADELVEAARTTPAQAAVLAAAALRLDDGNTQARAIAAAPFVAGHRPRSLRVGARGSQRGPVHRGQGAGRHTRRRCHVR